MRRALSPPPQTLIPKLGFPLRAAGYQYALVQEGAELARQVYFASARGACEVTRRVTLVRKEALDAAAAAAATAGGSGLAASGADAIARAARAAGTTPAEVLADARERSLGPAVHAAPSGNVDPGAAAGAAPPQAGQAGGAEQRDERGGWAGALLGDRPGRERRKEKKRKRRAAEAASAGAAAPRGGEGAAGPASGLVPAAVGGMSRIGDSTAAAAATAGDCGSSHVVLDADATAGMGTGSSAVAAAGLAPGARRKQPASVGVAGREGVPAKAREPDREGQGADGKEKSAKKDKKAKKRRHSHAERGASVGAAADSGRRASL